jgi:hypothetical protein
MLTCEQVKVFRPEDHPRGIALALAEVSADASPRRKTTCSRAFSAAV